jgi:hypothetical protein
MSLEELKVSMLVEGPEGGYLLVESLGVMVGQLRRERWTRRQADSSI